MKLLLSFLLVFSMSMVVSSSEDADVDAYSLLDQTKRIYLDKQKPKDSELLNETSVYGATFSVVSNQSAESVMPNVVGTKIEPTERSGYSADEGRALSDSCGNGEALVTMYLKTDSTSSEDNVLFLLELDDFVDEVYTRMIWDYQKGELENEQEYELFACVDAQKCWLLVFYDLKGDGLADGSNLKLLWNGNAVLEIDSNSVGEPMEDSNAEYWAKGLGKCDGGSGNGHQIGDVQDIANGDDNDEWNCMNFAFSLDTDSNAEDFRLLMFDTSHNVNGEVREVLLYAGHETLEDNTSYNQGDDALCLDPKKCYMFILYDRGGDGFSSGGLKVEVQGYSLIDAGPDDPVTMCQDCQGDIAVWGLRFGACASGTDDEEGEGPGSDEKPPEDEQPPEDEKPHEDEKPPEDNTDDSCLDFTARLETDSIAKDLMIVMYDKANVAPNGDIENFILHVPFDSLEEQKTFTAKEDMCLDPEHCYMFYLLSRDLNGVSNDANLLVESEGKTVLDVKAGNDGTLCSQCSPPSLLWHTQVGNCIIEEGHTSTDLEHAANGTNKTTNEENISETEFQAVSVASTQGNSVLYLFLAVCACSTFFL